MLPLTPSRKMVFASILGAVLVCLVQPRLGAGAPASTSIVFAVDYTLDGRANEDGGNAIETYLQFVLSRISYGKPQRMEDYYQDCKSRIRVDDPQRPCPLPDYLIQVQIDERQGEFQISGAASRNVEPKSKWPLDATHGKVRDLPEGLWRVASSIVRIIPAATLQTGRPHVVIACIGSSPKQTRYEGTGPRLHGQGPASVMSEASAYAERLPKLLASHMKRDESRIRVSINNRAGADCSSPDGLQNIASIVNATAVLTGTVYPDDKGGLFVVPYLLISAASKGIQLPQLPIPAGNPNYDVSENLATLATALIDFRHTLSSLRQSEKALS